ncbi:hypothetical protein DFR86_00180 [Acidianus sulfidivorans JP7]|uniref:CRISPR type III-associated protein domain-containing protein n=1 Tax=Acidianus sulfidivorans JP7 TaxID=619593 RepID=A0A2U9IJ99_9CREN|nr:RAMP superfamily CRISPR-associated protein [Acidianus sulfidivorans]AWR96119.1 hypothetical protein DFR86_00180 [Acidianus sulfidivorans JP7]
MIQLFKLNFKSNIGFRVGSPDIGDNVIRQLKIGEEGVMIPASSWKGMFRRVSEIVLNNKEHFEGHSNDVDINAITDLAKKDDKFRKIVLSNLNKDVTQINEEELKDLKEIYNEYNCPIERLYGGNYFAGSITISDSVIYNAKIAERTHVTIERKSKKGFEKHLFTEEVVNSEKIGVKVIIRNEFELWKNTLKFLKEVGYFIGASKSRGIGYIVLDDSESEYAVIDNVGEIPKFKEIKGLI